MKLSSAKNIMVLACFFIVKTACAQPNTTIDLEKQKPDKYKEKSIRFNKKQII
jgi:hypothetical protein